MQWWRYGIHTELRGKPSAESQADSESNESLESSLSSLDSQSKDSQKQNLESNPIDSESTTSKNLSEALPNIKNSVRDSASRAESKTDSESMERLESSLLDSRSHGYFLDSQSRLFAQKEKGFPLSPLSPAPKKIKRRCFCCALLVTRWVFLRNHKVYLLAGVPRYLFV